MKGKLMAIYSTTPYIKMSFTQILRAVGWCQNALNLRDWTIHLEMGDEVPDWVQNDKQLDGLAYNRVNVPYFTAWVWISPGRCKENNTHPIEVICHEMLHILLSNYGIEHPHDERMVITLEYHVFQTWLNKMKKNKKTKGPKNGNSTKS